MCGRGAGLPGKKGGSPEDMPHAVLSLLPDKGLLWPLRLLRASLSQLPGGCRLEGTGLLKGSLFRKKFLNPVGPKSVPEKAL